jgi:GT2 family glycosyltransferase
MPAAHADRPAVSVVMPFAGDHAAAAAAVSALESLATGPGDELILVDNSPEPVALDTSVRVIRAAGERSPAHARNAGAAAARNEWILFLDADTIPHPDLLDAFFADPVGDRIGAVTGEVLGAPGATTLAARYGAARNFLSQQAHLEHPFRPRAAAANLLVRRGVFEQLGGFYEGVRAGEDTDFTWRLQEAGWELELRAGATVEHRYRTTVGELRRQWRGYAAGRAWLGRRYEEFRPEPAATRALKRTRDRGPGGARPSSARLAPGDPGRLERGRFLALDVLLGFEELAGFALSNKPTGDVRDSSDAAPVHVVLVAESFPVRGDPLVELAGTLEHVRVEALARPAAPEPVTGRAVAVEYLEDDGAVARLAAATILVLRHPVRATLDTLGRQGEAPPLRSLAPAVRRLERDPGARIHALGGSRDRAIAARLARLAGRAPDS